MADAILELQHRGQFAKENKALLRDWPEVANRRDRMRLAPANGNRRKRAQERIRSLGCVNSTEGKKRGLASVKIASVTKEANHGRACDASLAARRPA